MQTISSRVDSIERKQRAIQRESVFLDDPTTLDEKLTVRSLLLFASASTKQIIASLEAFLSMLDFERCKRPSNHLCTCLV